MLAIPNIDWGKILPWLPWILAGVVLLFLLIFLWIYVASVYRFVLFDSVLYDRCELKGSWGRWEPCGRSYFYWCLAIFVVFCGRVLPAHRGAAAHRLARRVVPPSGRTPRSR